MAKEVGALLDDQLLWEGPMAGLDELTGHATRRREVDVAGNSGDDVRPVVAELEVPEFDRRGHRSALACGTSASAGIRTVVPGPPGCTTGIDPSLMRR